MLDAFVGCKRADCHAAVSLDPIQEPSMRRSMIVAVLSAMAAAANVSAQEDGWSRFMPGTSHFQPLIADPLEPRFTLGLLRTNVLAEQGPERPPFYVTEDDKTDVVAAVGIGMAFPFVALKTWEGGGINLTGHVGVFSRFRIENPSRDDMGQDWVVGGGIEMLKNDLAARLRIHHRSSHLGDEFTQSTTAERIEFGGEAIEGVVAYKDRTGVRVYGGGSFIFHSNTGSTAILQTLKRDDRLTAQLGADGEWYKWSNGHVGLHGGIDWQAAQRTRWQSAVSGLGGVAFRRENRANARELRLSLRYFSGPSPMGEFFLTKEQYLHFELMGRL
jgi:hypothetical protein